MEDAAPISSLSRALSQAVRTTLLIATVGIAWADGVILSTVSITSVARDPKGAVVVAGQKLGKPFVARLSEGSPGSLQEVPVNVPDNSTIAALAFQADGSLYLCGTVATGNQARAFVQKYTGTREPQYTTFIGGSAIGGSAATSASSIAVNGVGEAVVNGTVAGSGFPATVSPPDLTVADTRPGFFVKLDGQGNPQAAVRGVGIGKVAFDPFNNIYVAGIGATIAPTGGAFQTSHAAQNCAGNFAFLLPCSYQHISKWSPDGSKLVFATFLTGEFGATPAALAIDEAGRAIVAGTTNSRDYPTTAGAFQPEYRATATLRFSGLGRPSFTPPAASGYITKLNANGTGLVWSSYFSGTGAESISNMQFASDGSLWIAGFTASLDLPHEPSIPPGCSPVLGRDLPYIARISPDGGEVRDVGIAWTLAEQGNRSFIDTAGLSVIESSTGAPIVVTFDRIASLTWGSSSDAFCMLDPADWTLLSEVAPGQLLTVFGNNLDPQQTVLFNGSPAAILYSSQQQINVQAPIELADQTAVTITVIAGNRSFSLPLSVVRSSPAAFLSGVSFAVDNPGLACGNMAILPAFLPVADNDDGTYNNCAHPAPAGSHITLYFNGAGLQPSFSLPGSNSFFDIESAQVVPGFPAGFWRLKLRVSDHVSALGTVSVQIDGKNLRVSPLGLVLGN